MIVNHGPALPEPDTVLKMCLQTTHADQKRMYWLDHNQSSLMTAFVNANGVVDKVFQTNFWKSLKLSTKTIPSSYQIVKIHKSPRKETKSNVDYSKVFFGNKWHPSSNFKLEHPHIFVGRGEHPLRGTCKFPVMKSDITLNTFGNKLFHEQGYRRYVHEPAASWSARWCDPLTNQWKYVTLRTDETRKFELARKLKRNLHKVHGANEKHACQSAECRQLALACHLIEKFGIRVGNDKGSVVGADTVGCCTLQKQKHVRILDHTRRIVELDFDGKDSVRFHKMCSLDDVYFKVLKQLFIRKDPLLFDLINPSKVNRYLSSLVPGVSAKVFRTLKASNAFQTTLKRTNDLRLANLKAARACNHKTKTRDNLQTSRNNYIDPRIYYAHIHANPKAKRTNWFVDANWAKQTKKDFIF